VDRKSIRSNDFSYSAKTESISSSLLASSGRSQASSPETGVTARFVRRSFFSPGRWV
jgi:hypothetical protein